MSDKPNNPAAFPLVVGTPQDPWGMQNDGMTLRDWYAGMALQGMLSNTAISKDMVKQGMRTQENQGWHAETAYAFADAMLRERERNGN